MTNLNYYFQTDGNIVITHADVIDKKAEQHAETDHTLPINYNFERYDFQTLNYLHDRAVHSGNTAFAIEYLKCEQHIIASIEAQLATAKEPAPSNAPAITTSALRNK